MIVKKNLKKLKAYTPGKPIEELKRQMGLGRIYKLASNEVPFSPAYIRKAVSSEIAHINRYPESGCFYLRRALSRRFRISEDQIVFGNGSDELIVLALKALCTSGDTVVVGFPTFLIYEIQARAFGIRVKRIPHREFRYDLKRMRDAVNARTRMVFIANPDNPNGSYLKRKEIERFLKGIPKDVIVFFDEAYYEFAPRSDFPKSLAILKRRPNTIITRTFSKAYGLAGLRIGYGFTSKMIARLIDTVREPFNINRMAQVAALAALQNKTFLKKVLSSTKREKAFLYQELKKLDIEYVPSATNFILLPLAADSASLYSYLLKRGIIVREMSPWGLKNCIRVTVGLTHENREFIKHLTRYLKIKR